MTRWTVLLAVNNCSALQSASNQELGRVLLMNTWNDACESQQDIKPGIERLHKQSGVKYLTNDILLKL
jgi:hypothetical protein